MGLLREQNQRKSNDFLVVQGDLSFLILKNTTLLIKYVFGCFLEKTSKLAKKNITMLENIHMLHMPYTS